MTTDSDEKAIKVMARAIADELHSFGTDISRIMAHSAARAAYDAYLKHCSSTLESTEFVERKRN